MRNHPHGAASWSDVETKLLYLQTQDMRANMNPCIRHLLQLKHLLEIERLQIHFTNSLMYVIYVN